jgi:hypothetical protein
MINHLPDAGMKMRIGEEAFLYIGRQFEVDFQGALLVECEMLKAEPGKGIADQPVSLDGFMANLAEAVRSRLQAGEGGIDLMDKVADLKAFPGDRDGLFQPKSSVEELPAKHKISGCGHRCASCG